MLPSGNRPQPRLKADDKERQQEKNGAFLVLIWI
jgi:hypothetical protein